jgi:phosphate ABC transporter phosphate-binding protein
METFPKYAFLGLVVLVIGGLVAIRLHNANTIPPALPLKAAGSTFVYPLIAQWSSDYAKTESGCQIEYQSIGSGAGIKNLLKKRVNFACSEAPLTDEELSQIHASADEVVHIPLALGAVVPVYNLPRLKGTLRFTGAVLAEIYLGKIRKWNDAVLRDLNPECELPDREIQVVRRSDASGTTYIWVDYLSKVSPDWSRTIGVGTEVKWPVGVAESGNEGVARQVQRTPGSVGYVELTYAYRMDLPYGLVRNRENEYVRCNLSSVAKAAQNSLEIIPEDLRFSLTDAPGKGSYPIAGATWAIAYRRQPRQTGRQLVDFLEWATGKGQDRMEALLYERLPEKLASKAVKQINQIMVEEQLRASSSSF